MDESAIYYENIYPTTIAKIGEKNVNVRTFGKDKMRISVVLTILADGSKLPPLLIFKGKSHGSKEKKLQKNSNLLNGLILVKCQENADNSIFQYWLNNIWFYNSTKKSICKSLLILDRATTHFNNDMGTLFNKYNAKYVLIPPGLTRFLQPLGVGINKDIKIYMRNADTNIPIRNGNKSSPTENEIIDIFTGIWYNKIRKEVIINSFKKKGISIKMDGSENYLVDIPDNILENFENPDEYIDEHNQNLSLKESVMYEEKLIANINHKNKKIDDYFH